MKKEEKLKTVSSYYEAIHYYHNLFQEGIIDYLKECNKYTLSEKISIEIQNEERIFCESISYNNGNPHVKCTDNIEIELSFFKDWLDILAEIYKDMVNHLED